MKNYVGMISRQPPFQELSNVLITVVLTFALNYCSRQGTDVVFQIVLNKSEQSLEYNWMPQISPARTLEE